MANLTLPRGKRGRPIIRTTDDMMDYWGERITAVAPESEYQSRSSIIMESDTLYHYGHHFPLATIYRRSNGRAYLVLLNGDEWTGGSAGFGTGTWQRQSQTRQIVARETAGTNIVSLVVPFSALDAAGIVRKSIRILDSREDRYETIYHESDERPGPLVKVEDPTGQTYVWSEQRHGHVHKETGEVFKTGWIDGKYIHSVPLELRDQYEWTTYTHIEDRPVMVDDPNHAHIERQIQHEWASGDAELQSDGKWHWTAERHWLGDALFSAQVVRRFGSPDPAYRRAKFLSSFDYNEPRPLYFLCEMPRTSARTIADALEALKPKTVLAAEAAGLEVLRQGDVFAIPTSLTTNELKSRAKPFAVTIWEGPVHGTVDELIRSRKKHGLAADVLNTNHRPTHLIVTEDGDYYGRGFLYHDPSGWGRTPDHRRLKLGDGKTWHRLVKNTVPKDRDLGRGRVSSTRMNQSGQNRAWTIGGSVD